MKDYIKRSEWVKTKIDEKDVVLSIFKFYRMKNKCLSISSFPNGKGLF